MQMDATAKVDSSSETSAIAKDLKKEKYFRQNVGKTGIVWNQEHDYFNERNVYNLSATKNYNLPSLAKIYVDPNKLPNFSNPITSKVQYEAWWNDMVKDNGTGDGFTLKDIFGHSIYFDNAFKIHPFEGEKRISENRSEYARETKKVIASPDEVWCIKDTNKKSSGITYLYVRYYQSKPVVVRVRPELASGIMRAYSLHDLHLKDNAGEANRKGILLYNKTAK